VIFGIVGATVAIVGAVVAAIVAAVSLIVGGVGLFAGGLVGLFSTPATAIVLFGAAFLLWGLGKIVFIIIGAGVSLLGLVVAWLFSRSKGDSHVR